MYSLRVGLLYSKYHRYCIAILHSSGEWYNWYWQIPGFQQPSRYPIVTSLLSERFLCPDFLGYVLNRAKAVADLGVGKVIYGSSMPIAETDLILFSLRLHSTLDPFEKDRSRREALCSDLSCFKKGLAEQIERPVMKIRSSESIPPSMGTSGGSSPQFLLPSLNDYESGFSQEDDASAIVRPLNVTAYPHCPLQVRISCWSWPTSGPLFCINLKSRSAPPCIAYFSSRFAMKPVSGMTSVLTREYRSVGDMVEDTAKPHQHPSPAVRGRFGGAYDPA